MCTAFSSQIITHVIAFSAPQSPRKMAALWTLAFESVLKKKDSTQRTSIQLHGFSGDDGNPEDSPDVLAKTPDQ